jgi:hypothetical protein
MLAKLARLTGLLFMMARITLMQNQKNIAVQMLAKLSYINLHPAIIRG